MYCFQPHNEYVPVASCLREGGIVELTALSGYISSRSINTTRHCIYVIRVSPGQRIVTSLLDFAHRNASGIAACHQYAFIQEQDSHHRSTVVCSGSKRIQQIAMSRSNVTIRMTSDTHRFLIRYQGRYFILCTCYFS